MCDRRILYTEDQDLLATAKITCKKEIYLISEYITVTRNFTFLFPSSDNEALCSATEQATPQEFGGKRGTEVS